MRDDFLGEASLNAVLHWFLGGSTQWLSTGSAGEPYKRVLDILRNKGHKQLEEKLLTIGGEQLVYSPLMPKFLHELIVGGKEFSSSSVGVVKGKPSQCHDNVIRKWLDKPELYTMAHGFVLSDDHQLWRHHSWLINNKTGKIIETTKKREIYYGLALDTAELQKLFVEEMILLGISREAAVPSSLQVLTRFMVKRSDKNG